MLRPRRLSWFPGLRDSVLDFQAATTVIRGTLVFIPMGTLGTRMSTTIRMPGIRIRIIPQPQRTGTVGIGLTAIIAIIITTATKRIVAPASTGLKALASRHGAYERNPAGSLRIHLAKRRTRYRTDDSKSAFAEG